jgi:UDP-N-acetylmuramoyl-tripeptide--D-alanyl-D-alanine ligase
MTPLTLDQVCQAVGSQIPAGGDLRITSICTDSRHVAPGCLFVALRGEKFDGHAFIEQVSAAGAIAALADHQPLKSQKNFHYIKVPDTRTAMGKLAAFVRRGLRGKTIAVAGSNGKTSTKHLIDAALRPCLAGSISPKSYNNDIGVPLTIFAANPAHDYLVLEIGTNHHGEIAPLAEIAAPDIAVITNCFAEHLEGLDDLDGVRRENAQIASYLRPGGLLIVNGDDPELLAALRGYTGRRLTFGLSRGNDLCASDIICHADGTSFRCGGEKFFVPLLGRHAAINALAAIAVARELNLPSAKYSQGLACSKGADMRLQLNRVGGISVLNDAYNANPASMRAALQTLCALPAAARRVAVLGEMRELGRASDQFHREIGQAAAECSLDALVCVGESAKLIADSAKTAGMAAERVTFHPDAAAAATAVAGWVHDGDLVLLKASRAIGLEKVAQAIGLKKAG